MIKSIIISKYTSREGSETKELASNASIQVKWTLSL